MKLHVILLGLVALLNTACRSTQPGETEICRTAYVARVPAENVEALKVKCAELKASGDIQRGGLYLREIAGETYLFQYLEHCKGAGSVCFQGLEKMMGADSVCLEPMERIFYEAGAADKKPEGDVVRIAMFTELKPEKEAHYRLLHDNPWPDVIAAIHKVNFRHFSIFLEEINGRVYLFGWLEYVGSDIAADDAINKKDPASIRWWKETDACQIAPEDAGDGMWAGMNEILFAE
jgi:L-rhamnose mutarotase